MEVDIVDLSSHSSSALFVTGDTRFSREYWEDMPFSDELHRRIRSAEYSITNLEAAMKSERRLCKTGPSISTSKETHQMLADTGFDAVSLANNHTMDYGVSGLERTLDTCDANDLDTVGAGMDATNAFEPVRCEIDGSSIGIFAVTEHEEVNASDATPGTCWSRTPGISSAIRQQSEEFDVTILLAHGGVEYVPLPPRSWRRLLHSFTRLNVDAVVCHHPHCPQAWEIIDETPIFYSLGNFLMYSSVPATKRSYGVNFVIDDGDFDSVEVVPLGTRDGIVDELSEADDPGYHRYLSETASRIDPSSNYEPYWQELAIRLFEEKYDRRFGDYGLGHLSALVNYPIRELDRLTRGCVGRCAEREKEANLLDYLGNESHRNVVTTALNIRVGNVADVRDDAVSREIDEWYPYYDGRPSRTWIEKYRSRLETLFRRLP